MIFVVNSRWAYIPVSNQTSKLERVIVRCCVNKIIFVKVRGGGGLLFEIDPPQLKSYARQNCSFHCVLCSQGEVYHVTVHVKLQHSLLAANGPF